MATIFTENYSGDYGDYYEFKVDATESDVSTSDNTSKVTAKAYLRRINSSSNGAYNLDGTAWSITIDGTKTSGTSDWDTRNTTSWQLLGTASKVITHDFDGSKDITIAGAHTGNSASGASKMGNASGSGTYKLSNIPRYATAKQSLKSKSLNSITINWSSDSTIDYIWYSKDNGSNWTGINVTDGKSGNYTISNLALNTTYKIKTRVRRKDSQLTTDSSALSVTTYDKARLTSAPNINLGDNAVINITNDSGAEINYCVEILNPKEVILKRTASKGSNTIVFTDEELDFIYKKMGNFNSITLRFVVETSEAYWDWLDRTCTLTGNQKTVHIGKEDGIKRGKVFIAKSGIKRGVLWRGVNGTARRCI